MVAKPNAALVDAYDTKHRAWVGQVCGASPMLARVSRRRASRGCLPHANTLEWAIADAAKICRTACIPPLGGRAATTSSQMTSTGASACAEWYFFLCVGVGRSRWPVPTAMPDACDQRVLPAQVVSRPPLSRTRQTRNRRASARNQRIGQRQQQEATKVRAVVHLGSHARRSWFDCLCALPPPALVQNSRWHSGCEKSCREPWPRQRTASRSRAKRRATIFWGRKPVNSSQV